MKSKNSPNIREMTAKIVAAYVGHNPTAGAELPALIESVYGMLSDLQISGDGAEPAQKPAVSPAKSVGRGFVVCLEDGLRFKSMKRHLKVAHGMGPEAYRAKWQLAKDHPIVAPAYSKRRSAIARQAKLGRRPKPKAPRAAKAPSRTDRDLKTAA